MKWSLSETGVQIKRTSGNKSDYAPEPFLFSGVVWILIAQSYAPALLGGIVEQKWLPLFPVGPMQLPESPQGDICFLTLCSILLVPPGISASS